MQQKAESVTSRAVLCQISELDLDCISVDLVVMQQRLYLKTVSKFKGSHFIDNLLDFVVLNRLHVTNISRS